MRGASSLGSCGGQTSRATLRCRTSVDARAYIRQAVRTRPAVIIKFLETESWKPLPTQSDQLKVEPLLLEVADVVNTTLDLDTTLRRVAELVRKVIDYEIFAILLLNEKAQDLRIRFQVGYAREVAERVKIKIGEGVTGLAAQRREAILVDDVSKHPEYISGAPDVRSELAIPLIVKNRVIGVLNLETHEAGRFTEEHKRLLTLIGSRMAVGIENARLHTRTTRQARTLVLLNEIARELTSILNVDELLKRIAELLSRLIDYQMFSILLVDAAGEKLQHRFSLRFQENIQLKHDVPLGDGLVGYAARHRQAVLVPDVSKDPRYILLNPETRSELAVPLIYKDKVIGVLDLEHTKRGFFTDDHKRTVTTLAAQVAIAHRKRQALRGNCPAGEATGTRPGAGARIAISPAAAILAQTAEPGGCRQVCAGARHRRRPVRLRQLLARPPGHGHRRRQRQRRPGGDLCGAGQRHSALARSHRAGAGGDAAGSQFFPGRAAHRGPVRLADLCGVGRSQPLPEDSQFRAAASACTVHDGKIEVIEATGLPLGLFDDAEYDEFTFKAKPGDMFVFFSDGILDARNKAGDMFGRHRTEAIIAGCADISADCVVKSLFKAATEHAAGEEAFDDETVVAIKVKGEPKRK